RFRIRDRSARPELSRVRPHTQDSHCAHARRIPGRARGPNGEPVIEKRPPLQMERVRRQGGSRMMVAKKTLLLAALALRLAAQSPLPGTAPLTGQGDFAAQMVDRINDYLVRASSASPGGRAALWKRDYASVENYERSIAPN